MRSLDTDDRRDTTPLTAKPSGVLFVISGPGGTGKSTLVRRWLMGEPRLSYVRNVTTRARRPDDPSSGVREEDFFDFVSTAEFRRMVEAGEFVQWSLTAKGYCSGTPLAPVEAAVAADKDVLFDYTPQLYMNLRRAFPEQVVGVFLAPPTLADLRQRLAARGDSEPGIALKYALALQDMAFVEEHEYYLVNDDLDETLASLRAVYLAEKLRLKRLRTITDIYRAIAGRGLIFYYDALGERVASIDPGASPASVKLKGMGA
jgi:guanylate kinase